MLPPLQTNCCFIYLGFLLTVVGSHGHTDEVAQDANVSAHKDDHPDDDFSVHFYSSFSWLRSFVERAGQARSLYGIISKLSLLFAVFFLGHRAGNNVLGKEVVKGVTDNEQDYPLEDHGAGAE